MTELLAERIRRYLQLNVEPEMVVCSTCAGKGYHHGFGEDGRDPDWCEACGGPGKVLHPDADVSPDDLLRDAESALSEARAEIAKLEALLARTETKRLENFQRAEAAEAQIRSVGIVPYLDRMTQLAEARDTARAERDTIRQQVSVLVSALRQIAEWPDAEMFTSLAPAQGMRGIAREVVGAYQLQQTQQPKDGEKA
jgi:hypothetical protein